MRKEVRAYMAALGKLGGKSRSAAKLEAIRRNGMIATERRRRAKEEQSEDHLIIIDDACEITEAQWDTLIDAEQKVADSEPVEAQNATKQGQEVAEIDNIWARLS